MKVTFLTGEYPPMQGGIADYTAQLATYLAQLDVDSAILISQIYRQHLDQSNVKSELPVYPHLSNWGMRCWPQINRFLRQNQSDVLHIQYQAAAFDLAGWVNWLPWYLHRWSDRPWIVTTFHDLRVPYIFPKAGPLRWQTMLALARYSDAVICTNSDDAATLRQQAWATHIHEIPLGNNIPVSPPSDYDRSKWRKQWNLGQDALVIAYFGFLNESKGGEDLIAVLAKVVQAGFNAYLVMIGGDVGASDPTNQAYAQRVHQAIAHHNLGQRIISTGFVDLDQVSAHLLAADLAVMPYRDGVSFRRTTLIAALQHGLPVVSTHPAHPTPQIKPSQNMLLAAPQDTDALADCVVRIATNEELRERLGQGAIELGKQFDWTMIATKTKDLYQPGASS